LLLLFLAGGSANAAIIRIDYTGTYSGTITTGNPAISQFTTSHVDSVPFELNFVFNTDAFLASYTDTPSSSALSSFFGQSVGSASGTFFASGNVQAEDAAQTGFTSQTLFDRTASKIQSNTPALTISVSHPDIPGSITQSFSISSGLTGSGSYRFETLGNFSYLNELLVLSPQTITVTVFGVPEPSTWAMLLIGFVGIGYTTYRRRLVADPA
jgi:PEP-CTERM motif